MEQAEGDAALESGGQAPGAAKVVLAAAGYAVCGVLSSLILRMAEPNARLDLTWVPLPFTVLSVALLYRRPAAVVFVAANVATWFGAFYGAMMAVMTTGLMSGAMWAVALAAGGLVLWVHSMLLKKRRAVAWQAVVAVLAAGALPMQLWLVYEYQVNAARMGGGPWSMAGFAFWQMAVGGLSYAMYGGAARDSGE